MKPDDELLLIAELARGGSGHSPLYRWLRARHDAFVDLVDETKPNWKGLAAGFTKLGLAGPSGRPLGAETVRHTWWRVRRDVAAARIRRAKPPAPPAVVTEPRPATTMAHPSAVAPTQPFGSSGADALARLRAEINQRSGRQGDG